MMTHNEVKRQSSDLVKGGNFQQGFEVLYTLGPEGFVAYAEKNNWLTKGPAAQYFWNSFLNFGEVFSSFFSCDEISDNLLFIYFSRFRACVPELESQLAKTFPALLVRAVRQNQSFVDTVRNNHLFTLEFPEEYRLHQRTWIWMASTEFELWNAVEAQTNLIAQVPVSKVLAQVVLWLETRRFGTSDRSILSRLGEAYSLFVQLYFSLRDKTVSENFASEFLKDFEDEYKAIESVKSSYHPDVFDVLDSILRWNDFKRTLLDPYCYNLEYDLTIVKDLVHLSTSPEAHYQWIVDGYRYQRIEASYVSEGLIFTTALEAEGLTNIPKGAELGDEEINRRLAYAKNGTLLLLKDLCIKQINQNENISVEDFLSLLLTYSINRNIRYEQKMVGLSQEIQAWEDAFKPMMLEILMTGKDLFPFHLSTHKEFIDLNKKGVPNVTSSVIEKMIQSFSYDVSTNGRIFNRFYSHYDVWNTPYLKISDFLFCPIVFIGSNFWFYSFIQSMLEQKRSKEETSEMEGYLAEAFERMGWKVKLMDDKMPKSIEGDVDVIVEDQSTLLYIQLKRTKFRLNPKDRYNEIKLVDVKAAQQLNVAEDHLKRPNDFFQTDRTPVKWIVSTSCEGINKDISGCRKINYFDVIQSLRYSGKCDLNSFVQYIEEDGPLKGFLDANSAGVSPIIEKPINLFSSSSYRLFCYSGDIDHLTSYFNEFNTALKMHEEGLYDKALLHLDKCLSINSQDGDVWYALANWMADHQRYEESFLYYQRALKYLRNDPTIERDYIVSQLEYGMYFEGMMAFQKLCRKYPLIASLSAQFNLRLSRLTELKLLSDEELSALKASEL